MKLPVDDLQQCTKFVAIILGLIKLADKRALPLPALALLECTGSLSFCYL